MIGMDGPGKSTTVQKVFCHSKEEDKFEKRMRIFVSQNFAKQEIMKNMYVEELGKSYLQVLDGV